MPFCPSPTPGVESEEFELTTMTPSLDPANMTRCQLIRALRNSEIKHDKLQLAHTELKSTFRWSVCAISLTAFFCVAFLGSEALAVLSQSTDGISIECDQQPTATETIRILFCPRRSKAIDLSLSGRSLAGHTVEARDAGFDAECLEESSESNKPITTTTGVVKVPDSTFMTRYASTRTTPTATLTIIVTPTPTKM
jgi:hypothetical protein